MFLYSCSHASLSFGLISRVFMGLPKMKAFKKMNAAIEDEDYIKASEEMVDSKWYRTVPNRADRLVQRMKMVS